MKKIIPFIAVIVLLFAGCSKDETPSYNLSVCDTKLAEMCIYLDSFESETFKTEKIDFDDEQLSGLITSLQEKRKEIDSITVYSKNISEEKAAEFISFAQELNIPVIFAFSNIATETLTSYDKAFCITTDYIHAGEITAEYTKQLWTDGSIADTNGDQIFSFSVIKAENADDDYELFYSTLIDAMELYGIPMQINSTVFPAEITDADALAALKAENEGIIVIADEILSVIGQYTTENETVEIITVSQGADNALSGKTFVLNCFTDYKNYKFASDEIIANYNDRQYPLIKISFPVKDRTVFIPATL